MTGFVSSDPLNDLTNVFQRPIFITANRAPTTLDVQPAGTQWMDGSVTPKVIYETSGAGVWNPTTSGGAGVFTSLTVTPGPTSITGTTGINTSGAGVTTINTGGTGALNLGNATGNTAVTGALGATTSLSAGTTVTAGTGVIITTGNLSVQNGDVSIVHNSAGADIGLLVQNTNNASVTANAVAQLTTGGASGGSAFVRYTTAGVKDWLAGNYIGDSSAWVISSGNTLGTNNVLRADATSGIVSFPFGISRTVATGSGAAGGTVTCNGRTGSITFTGVSIAAAADLTLTMGNTSITGAGTRLKCWMSGATTGSALSVKSVTASANQYVWVITNGTGATTTTANIIFDFEVIN